MLLLAADFYYLKNIAGRRLVGLRWWNEVDTATGDSHWVFESQDRSGGTDDMGNAKQSQNMTDKRFFWLSVYVQPALWIVLGILALVRFKNPIWLILIGEFGLSCCFNSWAVVGKGEERLGMKSTWEGKRH